MRKVLQEAEKQITPKAEEIQMVKESLKAITEAVDKTAKKLRIDASLFEGGSIAKNTWLPGISDMDFFLRFNYKYKDKDISKIAEKLLRKCFKIEKLHGSRDYFKTHHYGFDIEFVPVLKIGSYKQAKNITDVSPLHVFWLKKRKSRDIRLAKQFFKAAGVYGAESYIKGFSGYVIEILCVFYGSFERLVREISKWGDSKIIDVNRIYKSKKAVLEGISKDKRIGPLIVVDSVEPVRNAASVVSFEKFSRIKKYCKRFIRSPKISYFARDWVTGNGLIAKKGKRALVLMKAKHQDDKVDIAGARILKQFEYILRAFTANDFKVLKADWQWNKRDAALLWIYLDSKILSSIKRHWGPPLSIEAHANIFRKIWKKARVSHGRLYVDLRRRFRKAEDVIKELKRDKGLRNFKFL